MKIKIISAVVTFFSLVFIWWVVSDYKYINFLNETVSVLHGEGLEDALLVDNKIKQKVVKTAKSSDGIISEPKIKSVVTHIKTPQNVKAIYMSSWVASSPSVRSNLVELIDSTELNSVVIDVKDNTGVVSWGGRVRDIDEFVSELHNNNIYVIARISAFQDPLYVKSHPELAVKNVETNDIWYDHKGVPWIDTGSQMMWDYLVKLGNESYSRGFDEINYDYIRFPTDGDLKSMRFPISKERGINDKQGVVKDFYKYLYENLSMKGIPISGDVFGIITVAPTEAKSIGQDLHDALQYFDYVAPMVYPSHFYSGTNNFKNPAEHPGEIIDFSMRGAIRIAGELANDLKIKAGTSTEVSLGFSDMKFATSTYVAKLRPWYQDFDMGATYTAEMVRAQITAGEKLNITSWMLWDPANHYTPTALKTQ